MFVPQLLGGKGRDQRGARHGNIPADRTLKQLPNHSGDLLVRPRFTHAENQLRLDINDSDFRHDEISDIIFNTLKFVKRIFLVNHLHYNVK